MKAKSKATSAPAKWAKAPTETSTAQAEENSRRKRSEPKAPAASGKVGLVVQMLRAKSGASIEQLSKATGWQHHSVRGAISGAIKKKLDLKVTSERINGVRIYRIAK